MEQTRLKNEKLANISVQDNFWKHYVDLVEEVILPFQWDLINDKVEGAEKSYCIQNFKVACGLEQGSHKGMVFQDTDVAKWLEAVGYVLEQKENKELEKLADEAIDLIAGAQCEDGYLNTYYTITGEKRWSDLFEGHELYTAGHMIEAAVAYYQATGKRKFLDVVCRFADYMCEVFGGGEGKLHGYPGHPEVELALIRLYKVTGEKKYLELSNYFVRTRGEQPCYFLQENCIKNQEYIFPEFQDFAMDYAQAHMPLREQRTAEGHAVRAVYLYSAMADLAHEYQDEALLRQCEILWDNIVNRRMYITGSIGSAAYGERFTTDYDLPNDTNYSESCATVGLAMFSNRMLQITKNAKYADVVEQALYNTLLAGIAQDGKHFFYVNPLEVVPEIAEKNPTMRHVKTERQLWFGVACCPPNIARTLASIGNYIYAVGDQELYINLFIESGYTAHLENGTVEVQLKADYPRSGIVHVEVSPEEDGMYFGLAIRRPGYSEKAKLQINGVPAEAVLKDGYLFLERHWEKGDKVFVEFDVSFRFVYSNPKVRENIGKVCLMKGPWVYCLEETDNGKYLSSIEIDTEIAPQAEMDETLLGGTVCAVLKGRRINYEKAGEELYGCSEPVYEEAAFKAVPYCCWNNRGKGEMQVWMRKK